MNKKLILFFVTLILLACNFLFPPKAMDLLPAGQMETSEVLSLEELTIVRLQPGQGDVQAILAEEAQKAGALGLQPVVEFDATWCPPCQAIDRAIQEEQNELMLDAYNGTYIIKMDVDAWGWGDSPHHDFVFDGIPVYFKLDASGRQTGEVIDGGAWGQDIPENIAPVMDQFFHGN